MVDIITRQPEPKVMETTEFVKLVTKTASRILGQGRPKVENTGLDIVLSVGNDSESFTLAALTNNANTPENLEMWVNRRCERLKKLVGGPPQDADAPPKRKPGRPRKSQVEPESSTRASESEQSG